MMSAKDYRDLNTAKHIRPVVLKCTKMENGNVSKQFIDKIIAKGACWHGNG